MEDKTLQYVKGSMILHRVWLYLLGVDSAAAKLVDGLRLELSHEIAQAYGQSYVGIHCVLMWAALCADPERIYGETGA